MAERRRPKIPSRIEEEVLFLAAHTCCICRVRGKDVQVHHINGRPSDNDIDNLAVLCLDCHSQVTGARGLGKSYRAGEVRKYKRSWELQVQESRKVHRPRIQYTKELISQIDLLVCEIRVLDRQSSRIPLLFDLLYELYLWRGSREIATKLLEGMAHLALMAGLEGDSVGRHIPPFLWKMCWHLVGPEEVHMDRHDLSHVRRCLDIMQTLAEFNFEFGKGRKTTIAVAENVERFFEVGLWYSRKRIAGQVVTLYQESLKTCKEKRRVTYRFGIEQVSRSMARLRRMLAEERPRWADVDHRLVGLQSAYGRALTKVRP